MRDLPPVLQQVDRTCVLWGRRKLLYFAGCDYHRLASHPEVLEAARICLAKCGLNVAASRKTTGNHSLYDDLEKSLAKFLDAERALLVSSGYATNIAVAQAWSGKFSHVLLDDRAHSSLVDAAQFLDCPVVRFQHRNPEDVARVLGRIGKHCRVALLTDGVFSHDGSIAPLAHYDEILPRDAWMLVDDAHGAGTIGKRLRGSLEHESVSRRRIVQTITLSKAFGAYGGAIVGAKRVIEQIISTSRIFVGNTPLPLPLAAAARKSVELLSKDSSFASRLRHNTRIVKDSVGADVKNPCPIISIVPKESKAASNLKNRLLRTGIYPPLIQYPGGPKDGYFRFAISSEHSEEELSALLTAIG